MSDWLKVWQHKNTQKNESPQVLKVKILKNPLSKNMEKYEKVYGGNFKSKC